MTLDVETVYGLLPAVYRTRDAAIAESLPDLLTANEQAQLAAFRDRLAAGDALTETEQRDLGLLEQKRLRGPLWVLMEIVAEQLAGLEENIEQLYDDQFIETCAEWAVPYIAELVGYRPLDPQLQQRLKSARADVADTIGFRRRKGTAAMLESLAVAITDWDAAVVEFFLRLATTEYLNHIRPDHLGTVDLRDVDALEPIGGAFDRLSHTADIRRIATTGHRYNVPDVGIFLWRIGALRVTDSPATSVDARRYLFSVLGANTQLLIGTPRNPNPTSLAGPLDVPAPITRRLLRANLDALYGSGRSFEIKVGEQLLGPDDIEACDLADVDPDHPETSAWHHMSQTKVAVDPVLGRIVFPSNTNQPVLVTYNYGSIDDIGGGEYERTPPVETPHVRKIPHDVATIDAALTDLGGSGTVEISGSGVLAAPAALAAAQNSILAVAAANGSRPVLSATGDVIVTGGDSGEVVLDGLLLTGGRILVPAEVGGRPNRLQRLRIVHCTLVPGGTLTRTGLPGPAPTSLEVEAANVTVQIESSIVGAIRVTDESSLTLTSSIVDATAPDAIAYSAPGAGDERGGPLTVTATTVIGKVKAAELTGSDAIFHAELASADTWNAAVIVERRQTGYVRYSYVPSGAQVPPRYNCQPAEVGDGTVRPIFTSLRYGDPAYCQLHAACPAGIRAGADDGGEMGVYHDVYAPQRAAALTVRLDEYMRFGLEAGLIFAS